MKTQEEWDNAFRNKESICIQNVKPPGEGARNIFVEDKDFILISAKKFGFRIISKPKDKIVSFIKDRKVL